MSEPVQRAIDLGVRRSFPLVTTFIASLAGLIAIPAPDYSQIAPAFVLIAVYCWSIWRPSLMPLLGVFLIGLFEDLMRGLPLGVTAILLLSTAAFVQSQRGFVFGKSFDLFWFVFALIAVAWLAIEWLILSSLLSDILDPTAAFFRTMITVGLLPVGAALLLAVQRVGMQDI